MKETVDWIEKRKDKKRNDKTFMTKFLHREEKKKEEYSLEHQKEKVREGLASFIS